MTETISNEFAAVASKAYLGLNEQHGVGWIEQGWQIQSSVDFPEAFRQLKVDNCITEIVAENIKKGNKNITVLDIGSGSEGFFIKSFMNKDQFPNLHNLLENTDGVNLRVVGITGAKEGDVQGLVISKDEVIANPDSVEASRINVENYGYTVTKFHTLSKFLGDKNIQDISLAFSTFGIGYFTPGNFDQCLIDVADNLAVGGRFYGISWDAVPAGYERSSMLGVFYLPWNNVKENHPLEVIYGSNEQKHFDQLSSKDQMAAYINAFDFVIDKNLMSVEQVRELLIENNISPVSRFIDKNAVYTTETQKGKIKKVIDHLAKTYTWINDVDWSKNDELFVQVSRSEPYSNLSSRDEYQRLFNEKIKVKDTLAKYIKRKFASSMRRRTMKAKRKFNTEISGLDWPEIKAEIANQNQNMVANFWNLDEITYGFRKILTEQQSNRTTDFKALTIDRLSQRNDLEIYSSRITNRSTGNHGLNVLMVKR